MALFGAAASPLIVLGIPAAVLTGMAFAAPIAAFSATQRTPEKFNVVFRFGITPLFLFSGTFFPISNLPSAHAADRLAVAAVARRRARRRPRARHDRPGAAGSALAHVAVLVGDRRRGHWLGVPDRRARGWSRG